MRMILILMLAMVWVDSASAAKKALVYNGPGACSDGCYQSAFQVALQAGLDPVYVGAEDLNSTSSAQDRANLFKDAVLWLQPGGKSRTVVQAMTAELTQALKDFVNQGGGYVGFCAGAFASTKLVGTTSYQGFHFMPGKTILYPDPYTNNADIIPIEWQGKTRQIYWEGGPYLTQIPAGKAEIIAHYPNGTIASARSQYGKGKVYVTGLHPEAPQDWRDYYHLKDTDGLDQDIAVDMIHWATESSRK